MEDEDPGFDTSAEVLAHADVVQTKLHVRNICCEAEVRLINKVLSPLKGVTSINVNVLTRTALVKHCPVECCASPGFLVEKLNRVNLGASIVSRVDHEDLQDADAPKLSRNPFAVASRNPQGTHVAVVWALFIAACSLVSSDPELSDIMFAAATFFGGLPVFRAALKSVSHKIVDMNVLMTLAIVGASGSEEWIEAALVTLLFVTAELLERAVMDRVAHALDTATRMSVPRHALRTSDWKQVLISELKVGETIALRPGDSSPVDGLVRSGAASVSEAAVTGEALPIAKMVGSQVCSGSVVLNGYVEVELTSLASESALAQMAQLVMEAQAQRGRSQKLVDSFARYWTPTVLLAVFILCAIMPAATGTAFTDWLSRALVLLVLACPCALVLAAPIPTTCSIAAAAKHGVLLKRCDVVEDMANIKAVGLDKTGTLTLGDFCVTDMATLGQGGHGQDEKDTLLRLAAAVEACSAHPLANAIVKASVGCIGDAANEESALPQVQGFTVVEGVGVAGSVQGVDVLVGNGNAIAQLPDADRTAFARFVAANPTATSLSVVVAGRLRLGIALSDTVRPEAGAAVLQMRQMGCSMDMLTGDTERAAAPVAKSLRLDSHYASLLPEDKRQWVLSKVGAGTPTAVLGDGINDSTALAAATVGVAMGASGSALAARSADMVIMSDNLERLPQTMRLARRAKLTIIFNIAFASVVKLVAVAFALAGDLKLWMAVTVDVGSLLVVLVVGVNMLFAEVWDDAGRDRRSAIHHQDVETGAPSYSPEPRTRAV